MFLWNNEISVILVVFITSKGVKEEEDTQTLFSDIVYISSLYPSFTYSSKKILVYIYIYIYIYIISIQQYSVYLTLYTSKIYTLVFTYIFVRPLNRLYTF
jgi:hypothetical protein